MSTEVRQALKFIPAQVKLAKHVRYIYSCRHCKREEINIPVVRAPMHKPVLGRHCGRALGIRQGLERLIKLPPGEGLEFCNRIFAIERDLKDATPEERYQKRLVRSRPVLVAFWARLDQQSSQELPKSALGQAVNYCLSQKDKLDAFLQDGRLEIDNNRSERSIKPFVIGRKNWLFANTPRGAQASAIVYSIVETAKENSLNPFRYLNYLFEKLPNMDIEDMSLLDQVPPWSDSPPPDCRVGK